MGCGGNMKKMTAIIVAIIMVLLFIACSSSNSSSSSGNNDGPTGIATGLIRAFVPSGSDIVSPLPDRIFDTGDAYVFLTGAEQCSQLPSDNPCTGSASLVRVQMSSTVATTRTDFPDFFAFHLERLSNGYLVTGERPGASGPEGYTALISENGTVQSETYIDSLPAISAASSGSDNLLLFGDDEGTARFIFTGMDLSIQWQRTYQNEWDPVLAEGETLAIRSAVDVVDDSDASYVALASVVKSNSIKLIRGIALLRIEPAGSVVWARAFYPAEENLVWQAKRLLLKPDGTMLIVYGMDDLTTDSHAAVFLMVDAEGDPIWNFSTSASSNRCNAVMLSDGSSVIAWPTWRTGQLEGTAWDFYIDLNVAKLDAQGNMLWQRKFTDLFDAIEPTAISISNDGGILVVGYYRGFEGTATAQDDSRGVYLLKLDANGNCPDCS